MSLSNKLKSAGTWQFLQVVIQVISQFGYMAVMARLLSKSDFGLMALASSFVALGILFGEAGMGAALIQRKDVTQRHMNAALQASIIIALSIFLVLFISAKTVAVFFEQPLLEQILKVVGLIVILGSISNVSSSLLQKSFRFKHTSIVTMLSAVTAYTIGVYLAFLNYGVWSLVIASTINVMLTSVVFLYLAPVKLSFKLHIKEMKDLFLFSTGMILSRLLNYGSFQGLILILGKIFQPADLGVFERTFIIKTMPGTYLGNVLDTIMFPAMSEIQDEQEKLFRVYQYSLGIVNTILMPVAVLLIFFTKEIVLLLLGKEWLEATLPLQIMFFVLPFITSIRMADSVIRAKGLIYKNVIRRSIYLVVLCITASIGAYFYGILGAAIAVTFSSLFNYFIMLILVQSIFNKTKTDIFLHPVLEGLKLSIFVFILTLIPTYLLDNWNHDSLVSFFISIFFVLSCVVFVAWKKPSFLGVYIQGVINKILSK